MGHPRSTFRIEDEFAAKMSDVHPFSSKNVEFLWLATGWTVGLCPKHVVH